MPDLLGRDFTAAAPNTTYVGDITYLPYDGGHLYLATVIDCSSRRLVGWSIAGHMRTELVADALRAALRERGSLAHSNSPVLQRPIELTQYTSRDFAELCVDLGVPSSAVGGHTVA